MPTLLDRQVNKLMTLAKEHDLKVVLDYHVAGTSDHDFRLSRPFTFESFPTRKRIDDPLIRTHFLNERVPIYIDQPETKDTSSVFYSSSSSSSSLNIVVETIHSIVSCVKKNPDAQLTGYVCEAIDTNTYRRAQRPSRRRTMERRWIIEVEHGYVYTKEEAMERAHVAFRYAQGLLTTYTKKKS